MKYINLELKEKLYQDLNNKFNSDPKAINDFVLKCLSDKLLETCENKNSKNLEDYLNSSKPGSRSFGTKGQGW